MKIFKIVPLGFFLTFCFSNCSDKNKGFHYEVEAQNGGPNGFNNTICNCNTFTLQYSSKYSDSGYEKYESCCKNHFPKEVLTLIKLCNNLISQNNDTTGEYSFEGYKLGFKIENKFNFSYSISK